MKILINNDLLDAVRFCPNMVKILGPDNVDYTKAVELALKNWLALQNEAKK